MFLLTMVIVNVFLDAILLTIAVRIVREYNDDLISYYRHFYMFIMKLQKPKRQYTLTDSVFVWGACGA
jgi:hypothetical protein